MFGLPAMACRIHGDQVNSQSVIGQIQWADCPLKLVNHRRPSQPEASVWTGGMSCMVSVCGPNRPLRRLWPQLLPPERPSLNTRRALA